MNSVSDKLNNTRILSSRTLVLPDSLTRQLVLDEETKNFIHGARKSVSDILHGKDQRLLVIVGPCSIHDENVALEYCKHLQLASKRFANELFIVMRTYFEKPRTVIGWKGLISDPFLDGSCEINQGLFLARKLLLEISRQRVATATEFLDPIIPQYISDLISWTAIGARTSESQLHRELASGLSMPVGFKNSTDGNISIAMDAVKAAQHSHRFLGISSLGEPSIFETSGNRDCHVVLRGGTIGGNFDAMTVTSISQKLKDEKLCSSVIVDCSHGNSQKNYLLQIDVANYLAQQIAEGNTGIAGVMLESNLIAGKQELMLGKALRYGQSITDACISWEETERVLEKLALAVEKRMEYSDVEAGRC